MKQQASLLRRQALPLSAASPVPRSNVSGTARDASQRRRRRIERRRAKTVAVANAASGSSSIDDDDDAFASAFFAAASSRLDLPAVVARLVAGPDTREQVSNAVARGATAIWLCAGAGSF